MCEKKSGLESRRRKKNLKTKMGRFREEHTDRVRDGEKERERKGG